MSLEFPKVSWKPDETMECKAWLLDDSKEDIKNIPEIIQSPTNVLLSPDLYEGKPTILFEQVSGNEKTTVVAVVSDKHLDLRVQTEYVGVKKEKNLASSEGANAPKNTPKANGGTGFSTPIITEKTDLSSEKSKKVEKNSTSCKSITVTPQATKINTINTPKQKHKSRLRQNITW